MSNLETKIQLRNAIKKKCNEENSYYREVDSMRILIRCPFCGDSSDPSHAHFYVICDLDSNRNAGYICFKCNEHGPFTRETLIALGISDPNLQSGLVMLNKTSDKIAKNGYDTENKMRQFNLIRPQITSKGRKIHYLEDRLQREFSIDELEASKVVPSIHAFLDKNDIHNYRFSLGQMNLLEHNYIGFLSYGNSHLLLRDITGTAFQPWIIYPILPESVSNRVFYTISQELELFTSDSITINLSEGVMDILSVCYNLGYNKKNTLNVAVKGKGYEAFLLFLLDLGFVGSNITINVFADNDERFNKGARGITDLKYFYKIFQRFKYLYKEVNVYYNQIGKDCGVSRDKIRLKKYHIT